ncbi:Alpha-ketoglutarate-dependent dioxygenase oryG [Fulvia fulva]|uniref:Alpha-ketoglutarate-dependent dioxygenase oryG n=1 Tax=Passalora fulva TaxID=5499 RepID=A0A9Q8PBA7_PASFU|nr:Alpha-ketoglutarate-dependent dioxygenase oryG [Fulvia fulva]UJO19312.1 Alpha-ketoglutarate-dependent dioxygenase oryG [Fulvia fulva]WPV16495.1 Alpha-ketoglutarate-dependent dioxygenase oryG [Fulvia fulva]WPV31474.1 Alpha-ketoglutarate-dependent dioxygenase oryG [Fulvia fulva]
MHELHSDESERLLALFKNTVYENHYLTVRFKWRNSNDLAIWDDRSTFHTATYDYDGLGDRFGNRAVGIGEAPDIDPDSKTRREALSEP